ncbi:unnamed protein product [Urochloa decumbens]|uniref:Pectinesterase inhibitor domain-containing protein n=1 Tax=Urochloa decumbens TaxID=240449 RepID=A0ABC9B7G6_9POAL
MATTSYKAMVLLLLALLPLTTLASRAGPSSSHRSSHGKPPKHSPPRGSPSPPPPAPTTAALVRATCNSTTYPDLCVSALSADPSSATADMRGLSAIAVTAAAANASGGAATAAALANSMTNATAAAQAPSSSAAAAVQALLRTCAAKYGEARDALSAARGSIAAQDYDSASVHVSAAAEYPQVCRVLFQRQRPGAYPAELAAREVALRQLCTVSLDIITLLSNSS